MILHPKYLGDDIFIFIIKNIKFYPHLSQVILKIYSIRFHKPQAGPSKYTHAHISRFTHIFVQRRSYVCNIFGLHIIKYQIESSQPGNIENI